MDTNKEKLSKEFQDEYLKIRAEYLSAKQNYEEKVRGLTQELAERYRTIPNGTKFPYHGHECEIVGVTLSLPEQCLLNEGNAGPNDFYLVCLVMHPTFSGYYNEKGYRVDEGRGEWSNVTLSEAAIIAYLERQKEGLE